LGKISFTHSVPSPDDVRKVMTGLGYCWAAMCENQSGPGAGQKASRAGQSVLHKLGRAACVQEENEERKRKTARPAGLAWGGFEKSTDGQLENGNYVLNFHNFPKLQINWNSKRV
jgi:hypothetical protein